VSRSALRRRLVLILRAGLKKIGGVFVLTPILRERLVMRDRRLQINDRRQNNDMPKIPFKDSNGATIMQCRRKIPDRRIGKINAEGKKYTPSGLMRA
jgi:hypothetical protein